VDTAAAGSRLDTAAAGGYVDTVAAGGHVDTMAAGSHVDTMTEGGHVDTAAAGGHADTALRKIPKSTQKLYVVIYLYNLSRFSLLIIYGLILFLRSITAYNLAIHYYPRSILTPI
jgi:Cu/Zn superoxide dismutase